MRGSCIACTIATHKHLRLTKEFFVFKSIAEVTHDHIHTRWVQNDTENPSMFDWSCDVEHLTFVVNGSNMYAKRANEETGIMEPITREAFASIVEDVKKRCLGLYMLGLCLCLCFCYVMLCFLLFINLVAHGDDVAGTTAQLIQELQRHFPEHAVLDAIGIIYPQYWLQVDVEITFSKHLHTLKNWYCNARVLGSGVDREVIPGILDRWSLDSQQGYFKIAMKSNALAAMEPPYDINPVTRIWRTISASRMLSHGFPEYLKLAEIALVHVIGSVEDECVFSSVSFLKTKLRNPLDPHLGLVVGMYSQKIYTLQNFPYDAVFDSWTNAAPVNGRYGLTA